MTYKEIYSMASKNNITGDRLINKRLSKEGEDNWDKIFGKKIKEQKLTEEDFKDKDKPND